MNNAELLSKMSVEEKIALCCGADYWKSVSMPQHGIPSMKVADGPHGLRCQPDGTEVGSINESMPATCFPTSTAAGCSWDKELIREIGYAIGAEALANGVDTVLGPGVNIKRNPLCGRNFEYYSEDSYLSGRLGAAFITGVQETGAGACVKHFAANSQEYKRFSSDSQLEERTLRELYFPAFEYAVKNAKPAMVMCAYNKINGTYCSSNKWLLTDVLRREWGFDGMVVTDWGAMRDRAEGFKSGCDWAMPGGSNHLQRHSMEAYNAGRLSEAEINLCADRILTRVFASERARKNIKPVDYNAHHALARRAASESAVLLKNDGDILPLKTNRVALFGVMAKEPRYQGSGSSHINPARLTNLCGAAPSWTYSEGFDIKLARESDAAVIVTGLPDNYESEGFDREHMRMPEEQINLIEAVSAANLNTVVVLISGSPVEMPWLDKVKAVLYMGLPGQAGGEAALDVLTGAVNPSGKLAETWPLRYEDVPSAGCFGAPHRDAQYREGVFAGYRHYESAKTDVRFPFGFGLSYTKFEYNDLRVEGSTVTVNVKNTGITAGAEVVQLYISPPVGSIGRPVKELKGFEKIFLQPGERCDVTFELCDRCFAVWHKVWRVPGGAYGLHIGSSVKDIRLSQAYDAAGEAFSLPAKGRKDWPAVSAEPRKGEYTLESTIAEMARTSLAARLIKYFMARSIAKANGGRNTTAYKMAYASAVDCALFGIIQTSGGALPENVAMGILEMANGHVLRGMKMMLSKKQKD